MGTSARTGINANYTHPPIYREMVMRVITVLNAM